MNPFEELECIKNKKRIFGNKVSLPFKYVGKTKNPKLIDENKVKTKQKTREWSESVFFNGQRLRCEPTSSVVKHNKLGFNRQNKPH